MKRTGKNILLTKNRRTNISYGKLEKEKTIQLLKVLTPIPHFLSLPSYPLSFHIKYHKNSSCLKRQEHAGLKSGAQKSKFPFPKEYNGLHANFSPEFKSQRLGLKYRIRKCQGF